MLPVEALDQIIIRLTIPNAQDPILGRTLFLCSKERDLEHEPCHVIGGWKMEGSWGRVEGITLLGAAGGDHRLERVGCPGCLSNVF